MSLKETDKFALQEHILISTSWGLTYEASVERLTPDNLPRRVKVLDGDLKDTVLGPEEFSVIAKLGRQPN